MVPTIAGWIAQRYEYVPAVSNVCSNVAPCARMPLSNEPSSAVAVWLVGPSFVQRPVGPVLPIMSAGSHATSTVVTAAQPPAEGDKASAGDPAGAGEAAGADAAAMEATGAGLVVEVAGSADAPAIGDAAAVAVPQTLPPPGEAAGATLGLWAR